MFEEVATMDFPFEGIPTIPPRKNTTHMAAFCNGCRYRVTASPDMTVAQVTGGVCVLAHAVKRGSVETVTLGQSA